MADTYSAQYLLGKRRIEDNYNLGKADNDYAQVMERMRAQRGLDQTAYNQRQARQNLAFRGSTSGTNQRFSGQYQRAFGQYQQGAAQAYGDQLYANQGNMRALQAQYQSIWNNRIHDLDQNEVSEAERRAALAAELRGL